MNRIEVSLVQKHAQRFYADASRVIVKPLELGGEARIRQVAARVRALPAEEVRRQLEQLTERFAHRHRDFETSVRRQGAELTKKLEGEEALPTEHEALLGAYFMHEYSIEAAALFNPSIVLHPSQDGVAEGEARFIASYRATGEGHISSMEFREGVISPDGALHFDTPSQYATLPRILEREQFTTMRFDPDIPLSERVLFPVTEEENQGIEDLRLVQFTTESGQIIYYGTYTAYDGYRITAKLLETTDFQTFRLTALCGEAVTNKNMALFPRKVGGRYVMLSRQDGVSNFIMFSDDLHRWESAALLQEPEHPWEFLQVGNCGSPIETPVGWLVLTHGVGPMRQYAIGAMLLDLHDPTRVLAMLDQPLLQPDETEREGYVPNVVYTCGALLHGDRLVIPYAMSDAASGFATVSLPALLAALGA